MKTLIASLALIIGFSAAGDKTIYDFSAKSIDGKDIALSDYEGQVVMIVNVASKCGYTPQYESLQTLYDKYKDRGLVILGFPSNDFMGQEPGSDAEIKQFCSANYGVTFPMFSKIKVKGNDADPLYKYLTDKDQNGSVDGGVKWNFQKYLVNKEGQVVAKFSPGTSPTDAEITSAIEALL